MKKKILIALSYVLVIALTLTATIAYFTDKDSAVNVMTVGNIAIEQIEQERNASGNLVEFNQGKLLMPAHYTGASIAWADAAEWPVANDEAWKVVVDNNEVIDKFVTVKNTGDNEAYIRTIVAYEGDAINGDDIHIVQNAIDSSNAAVAAEFAATDYIENVEIGGVRYDLIVYTYADKIQPGETTIPSLKQIYMDKETTQEAAAKFGETYDVLVLTQAVQADMNGADAVEALTAGFGELNKDNLISWFNSEAMDVPVLVEEADELKEAITAGDDVLFNGQVYDTEGLGVATTAAEFSTAINDGADTVIVFDGTYTVPSAVAGKEVTIVGNGEDTVLDFTKVNNVSEASITFENLKVQGINDNIMNGYGIQSTGGDIVYKNCTFENAITHEYHGTVSYIDCTFTGTFYISTYALKSASFEGCVFDRTDSRALLVYSHGDNPIDVTVKDCTFKAAAKGYTYGGDWTAAVEVDTTNIKTAGTTVTIENCTADANYSGIVRDKSAANATPAVITVNGVAYTK